MAEVAGATNVMEGFSNLNIIRQVGLMVGLAASVAIGVWVVLYTVKPNYTPLFTDISHLDASQVADILTAEQIQYQIDTNSGILMVESDRIHKARMKLAAAGLPAGTSTGYELLDKEQGLGTSQFMERARYHRSIEGELARTISSVNNVRAARVHLAIPKRSVFVGDRRKPTASVLIELFPGRKLDPGQSAAIVHLVASSIPEMSHKDVTIVDQKGRLLSDSDEDAELAAANKQLDYTQKIETKYTERIEDILEPLLGVANFRTKVTANIDFTVIEQTSESYNPDLPALRSEQTLLEEKIPGTSGVGGVPGALSNQPGGNAVVPEQVGQGAGAAGGEGQASGTPKNKRSQATRNYELDRTISHTKHQVGGIRRLTVAVVVNDKSVTVGEGDEKTTQKIPLSDAEIARLTILIKDAIGFTAARGDSVNVINQSFHQAELEIAEAIPEPGFLDRPGMAEAGVKGLGMLLLLVLLLGVVRPVLKSLASMGANSNTPALDAPIDLDSGDDMNTDNVTLSGAADSLLPSPEQNYEDQLNTVKGMVAEDPKRVAQVVKSWLVAE